jgi:preprotein translocase subunit SecG
MFTFVATLHVLVAIGLIFMVLIQDSKGGASGGMFGGGGSQSILGATGAATLFVKITRWLAVVFALTCMTLTILVASRSGSVLEGAEPPPAKNVPAAAAVPANPIAPAPADNPAEKAGEKAAQKTVEKVAPAKTETKPAEQKK